MPATSQSDTVEDRPPYTLDPAITARVLLRILAPIVALFSFDTIFQLHPTHGLQELVFFTAMLTGCLALTLMDKPGSYRRITVTLYSIGLVLMLMVLALHIAERIAPVS